MTAWEPLEGHSSLPLIKAFHSFSRTASAIVVLIGIIGILGWVFNFDVFKSVLPAGVAMKINTAIALTLAGSSLWLWHRSLGTRAARLVSQACAVAVFLIGLLTLIEYGFHVDLGIDQMWFKTPLDPLGDAAPGRMAVHTAFNFLLLGTALLLLNRRRADRKVTQLLATTIFLIALLGLLGYLFGNALFYRIGSPTSMAVHTSIAFLLSSLGILFACPEQGAMAIFIRPDAGGMMARRLFPAAIVIPPLVCWFLLLGSRSQIYTAEMGMSLLSLLTVLVSTLLIGVNARSLSLSDRQRRQAQSALQQINELLEQQVEKRTWQLQQTNEQLQTEIVDRKSAQAALQDALQRLSFHVENSPLGVVEWDREFRITRWSTGAEQIFGWRTEELVGKCLGDWSFIHEEDKERVEAVAAQFFLGNLSQRMMQNRNYAKDQSVVHCEWYNSALVDASGKLVSVLSLVLDVSDRVRVEAERDRLLALEQAARAEAEKTNRLKDDFLAVVSHELRSPLNAILGWLTLLRTHQYDAATTTRALATVERNARAQGQLIEDLLDISCIIQGQLRLNMQPISPVTVIEAAIETVRPAAEAKSIRLQSVLDPAAAISGDANRLQQVIWNLLSNAIKFTPEGGQVQICLQRVNAHIEIIVTDTGEGIQPDFLPYVFDRFRQADSSITRKFGGLGLGLAIVRHLIELQGGTVGVESPGVKQGTSFTVKLPQMPTSARSLDSPDYATENALLSSDAPNLRGLEILIVDDEIDACELIAQILTQYGADVFTVSTAEEAITVLTSGSRFRPHVLVSDIGMPIEDGYALMRRVRRLEQNQARNIPAIALTAFARAEDRKAALLAGFQSHVAKPVDPTELAIVVSTLARRTRQF